LVALLNRKDDHHEEIVAALKEIRDPDLLLEWGKRVLTAERLADVFRS